MTQLHSDSVEETIALGTRLAELLEPDDVVVLTGDLGAGKTHFAKGVAAGLDIQEQITSPTFAIVEEYDGGRLPLLHFDLYRLETVDELDDIDFYALTESGAASLIEWGDRFVEALPQDWLHVDIRTEADGGRTFALEGHGPRGEELAAAFG